MQPNNFYKPISLVMIVVVLLLSGTLFYLMSKKDDVIKPFTEKELAEIPFYAPPTGGGLINDSLAFEMIKQYHKKGRLVLLFNEKKLGLWHDSSSLRDYIRITFQKFVAGHVLTDPIYTGYKWSIGFYYALSRPDSTKPYSRLNICLIPTLVNESLQKDDQKRVIDFFDAYKNPAYPCAYNTCLNIGKDAKQTTENYIYDTGEIWP